MISSINKLISKSVYALDKQIRAIVGKDGVSLPLKLATSPWPGYEFLYLAQKLGKLDVSQFRLIDLASASEVMYAMSEGVLDAAALTLDETLYLVERGVDLKVIMALDISTGSHALLSHPEISRVEELRNCRIGVEKSTTGSLMVESALNHAGLTRSDVQLISLPLNQHLHAYNSGEVDALISYGVLKKQLKDLGAKVRFDSGWISGRIINVLAVRTDILENRLNDIQKLVKSHYEALDYYKAYQNKGAEAIANKLQVSTDELLQIFEGMQILELEDNKRLLGGIPPELEITLDKLIEFMTECGLLQSQIIGKNLFDSRCLFEDA